MGSWRETNVLHYGEHRWRVPFNGYLIPSLLICTSKTPASISWVNCFGDPEELSFCHLQGKQSYFQQSPHLKIPVIGGEGGGGTGLVIIWCSSSLRPDRWLSRVWKAPFPMHLILFLFTEGTWFIFTHHLLWPGQAEGRKHSKAPWIPPNSHAVPARVQRAVCNICFLLPELTRKQTAPDSLLAPRSLDLQDGALIFSVFVPGKEFCSVHRSLKLRTPETSGHRPEVRVCGQRKIKTRPEECHKHWTRKQRPSEGLLSK